MHRVAGIVVGLVLLNFVAVGVIGIKVFADDTPSPRTSGPVGTAFAFQGRLAGSGTTVNGSCDLQFTLFDDLTNGSPVGSTLTKSSVAVANGLFSTTLDFGDSAFSGGESRWLEIGVRCPAGGGSFTTLPERQALTSTPFAQYANHAPWSGLTGVPDGLGSGTPYANVLVVAKSGGDFTSIQAAINSVSANSGNRYLVWIAPGTYQERVSVPQYVDLLGAGRGMVTITAAGSTTVADSATVTIVANASLRSLTVENTGGANFATGIISTSGGTVRLFDVEVKVAGANNNYGIHSTSTWIEAESVEINLVNNGSPSGTGVLLQSGSLSTFRDVSIYVNMVSAAGMSLNGNTTYLIMDGGSVTAQGGTGGFGVFGAQAGYIQLTDVDISASASGAGSAQGISVSNSLLFVDGGEISATSGGVAIGIESYATSPQVSGTRITAEFGTSANIGLRHQSGGTPLLSDVIIHANGTGGRAVTNTSGDGFAPATTVTIMRSFLQGNVNSVASFTPNITYKVSGSHLDGPVGAIGTYVCANSDGGNFKDLTAACAVTP